MLTITDVMRYGEFKPHSWEQEVQSSFDSLIDLIQLRVNRDGVEGAMNSLLEKVFELRMMLIPELLDEKDHHDFLDFVLDRQLEIQDQPADQYDQFYADVLAVLHHISYQNFLSVRPKLAQYPSPFEYRAKNHTAMPTLPALREALPYLGAPEAFYNLLEASLKADFNGMLYELLQSDRLPFLQEHKKEIVQLAFKYTEEMGFYSALLDLWKPEEEDEQPLVRNVKIRLAVHQLSSSADTHAWSLEQVRDIVLND